jgi:hypothetical protein
MVEKTMDLENPLKVWKFRDAIFAKVNIVDLMREFGLILEPKPTGQFTHRTRCPFHTGKGPGPKERTPSMFVSRTTNSFYCFGCWRRGTIIDFIKYMEGIPDHIALTKLAKKVGIIDKDGKFDELQLDSLPVPEPTKNIEPFLFEISDVLRNYMRRFMGTKNFDKELRWMERVGAKVDEFLTNIGYEDWEYAQELCDQVKKSVKDRIRSKGE